MDGIVGWVSAPGPSGWQGGESFSKVSGETYYIKGNGIPPQNHEISESIFFQNAACALYGIFHTDLEHGIMNYNDITWEDALHFSDELIFARVNCKKETGGPTCNPTILNNAVREYFEQQYSASVATFIRWEIMPAGLSDRWR